jgi:hypothetical protein
MWYPWGMSDTVRVVKVRVYVDGRIVEVDLPGPLVAMPVKTRKGSK